MGDSSCGDLQTDVHTDIYKGENLWYNRNSTNEKYGELKMESTKNDIWNLGKGVDTVDAMSLSLILNQLLMRIETLEEELSDLRGEMSGKEEEWE